MILIISQNHIDEPTNDVIDWLRYFDYSDFIRINGEDYFMNSNFTIDLEERTVVNSKSTIFSNQINCVFYRRWFQNQEKKTLYNEFIDNEYSENDVLLLQSFMGYLSTESVNSSNAFFSLFSYNNQYWIPDIRITRSGVNKIETLRIAEKNGLQIPATIITTNKSSVLNFKKRHGKIITKPIKDISFVEHEGHELKMYTKSLSIEDIESMPQIFFPCLYQQEIDKYFEIRTFFLEDNFFSTAIFSQNDSKTKIDFRNYNVKKPNRMVPFKLPIDIEIKLYQIMKEIGLNTGSIDLLVDENNNFFFLEVNPVGQLGMVSSNGNYFLEKIIAKKLIKNDKKRS